MNKEMFKKTGEELQEFLAFRKRAKRIENKKGKGSYKRAAWKREDQEKFDSCPRCKQPPFLQLERKFIHYECVVHCCTFGCKFYWPLIITGFNKEATINKAAERWNKAVEEFERSGKVWIQYE